jgi:exopolysaccharide biosynthesis polyprenyl glycosylphosphotransferase
MLKPREIDGAVRMGSSTTTESQDLLHLASVRTREIIQRRQAAAGVRRRGWLVRRMLLLADVVGLTIAFVVAQALFSPPGGAAERFDRVDPWLEALLFLATLPGWVFVANLYRLYDRDEERTDHTTFDDVVGVFHLVTIGAWLFFAASWLTGLAAPDFPKLLTFWTLALVFVTLGRAGARAVCRGRLTYLQNAIIVGAGDVGQVVARKLLTHPEYGINLVGFVDSTPKERREELEHLVVLGSPEDLPEIIDTFDIERVIVAFSGDSHHETLELVRSLQYLGIQVDLVPRLFEIVGPGVGVHTVEGLPLLGLPVPRLSRSSRLVKRTMDTAVAMLGLIVLAPPLAAIALLIKIDSRGPVFFRQIRMGTGNRPFRIYKFRTMTADADDRKPTVEHMNKHLRPGGDARMFKIPDDPRVTRVGRMLRRYMLDEVPQLLNVLKGEMSLVGPRPLILDEDRHVDGWARRRLDLKPGMTGLWQVLGRSDIPFEEMVTLDYLYITTWSPWSDVRIIFQTLPLLVRGRTKNY